MIEINCKTQDSLHISDLTEFQGELKHREESDIKKIVKSIKKHGFCFPFFVWSHDGINHVFDGHGRLLALKWMQSQGEEIPALPVVFVKAKNEADAKELLLKLNSNYGKMSQDSVIEFLDGINIDFNDIQLPDTTIEFDIDEDDDKLDPAESKDKLIKQFIVPPFSVLDTRQGYWQERKKYWLEKTGNLSETRDGDYGTVYGKSDLIMEVSHGGTSNFDPVFAELMMKWFCVEGGRVLDPFGGEQTKGVVAGELGFEYNAVEFRQDQVDLNNEKTKNYKNVRYVCGDSNNIKTLIKERDFDFCFTSPPYYDLEVYSKEDMSALGTYEEFMAQYRNIFSQCYDMLADDTFLCIKISEIRNKKTGEYRSFVADNIDMFRDIGFKYYNELIILNQVGTIARTCTRAMNATRKIGRIHQNVLVFYKGNLKNIKGKFKPLDFSSIEEADADDDSVEISG